MRLISTKFSTNCKEATSEYGLVSDVINLAKKAQTVVADLFYRLCYMAFPSMRVDPTKIWGKLCEMKGDMSRKHNTKEFVCRIFCGNQAFENESPEKSEEIEEWYEGVSNANRARPFCILVEGKSKGGVLHNLKYRGRG